MMACFSPKPMRLQHVRTLRTIVGALAVSVRFGPLAVVTVPRLLAPQAATATIESTVQSDDLRPLDGLTVVSRHTATGFEATTRTNPADVFVLRQLPLGGPYTLTVRALGHRAEQRTGITLALNVRVVLTFRLARAATDLAPVVVAADQANVLTRRLGASTLVTAEDIRTLPVLNRNCGNLTAITPPANVTI